MTLVTHKYTPAGMSDRELQETFAAREHTVEYLLKSLRDQIHAGTPSSFVVTGPRGAGKSTLIRLVALRIRADPVLNAAWIPIVFPEEQFNVYSLRDLLAATIEILAKEDLPGAKSWLASVEGEASDEQSLQLAITGLKEITRKQGRRLVLFVENIHLWLEQSLDPKSRGTLRRLLMNEPFLMLVGSAIRVLDSLKKYDEALFNYLGEVRLDRLDTDQVFELLRRRAVFDGNDAFLRNFPAQRPKVRAIAQLSGGNPRLTLMLYELLSHLQASTVVQYLRRLVDELTPLFKHEIENLPPQQRKIIHALMEQGGTAKPTDLVAPTRLRLNAVTTQLKRLRDAQFVEVSGGGKGRPAYYSTPDRLFGIWYQMRYLNQNRRRIELLVEALRIWFEEDERLLALKDIAEKGRGAALHELRDASTTAEYLAASLRGTQYEIQATESSIDLWTKTDLREAAAAYADVMAYRSGAELFDEPEAHSKLGEWLVGHGDHRRAIQALDECIANRPADSRVYAEALVSRGFASANLGNSEDAVADFTAAIALAGAPSNQVAKALSNRGVMKGQRGDVEGAIADFTAAIDLEGAPNEQIAIALFNRGFTKEQHGHVDGAIDDYTSVIELDGAPSDQVARALSNRGALKGQRGDFEAATADYTAAVELEGAPSEQVAIAFFNNGVTKGQRGDVESAIADYTAAIELEGAPSELVGRALVNRGVTKGQRGDIEAAIADFASAIALEGSPSEQVAKALVARGITKGERGDVDGAIADYTAAIELKNAPNEQVAMAHFNRGVTKGQRGDLEGAVADFTVAINLVGAPRKLVAQSLFNRGITKGRRGNLKEAITDFTSTIDLVDAPRELVEQSLFNRGIAKGQRGDVEGAIADYSTAIEFEGAPRELVARALVNRGAERGKRDDVEGAISDCSAVIELEDAPSEQVAKALVNRGNARTLRTDVEGAIADYTSAINLESAPRNLVARALLNRGIAREQRSDLEGAIADYTSAITLDGAPIELVVRALLNRGITKEQRGDVENAITDYTSIITLEGAPKELVAQALVNRGVTKGQRGDVEGEIADYTSAIELEGAPSGQVAMALANRGVVKVRRGDVEGSITDFTAAIDLQDAPTEYIALALFNRGNAKRQRGDVNDAVTDYTKILTIGPQNSELTSDAASAAFETISQLGGGDAILLAFESLLASTPLDTATETTIRFLNKIAVPKLKSTWPKAWRSLSTNLRPEIVESLRLFEPVCLALETGSNAQLAALPPEQRDFVENVLRRFDVIDNA